MIDELTVALPSSNVISLLTREIDAVDGVSVEDIRPVDNDRADPNLAALAVGSAMAESNPAERLDVLCIGIRRIMDADWVVALRGEERIQELGEVPDIRWLQAFLAGSEHLDATDDNAPSDMVWAHLVHARLNVAAGRSGRPIHERERIRISLLARLADALL